MENKLPPSWSNVQVADVGTAITGNTPPKNDRKNYGDFIPLIKPPELMHGVVIQAEDGLSKIGAEKSRILPPYSILVSCIGNLGRTGINAVPVAFNQQINAIIPFEGIEPRFIFYQAQSLFFRDQLEELSSATTIAIINKGNFQKIGFRLAPKNEQKRIVAKIEELFSELDKGIENLKTAREQLKVYRQAVLKHAFEGKLTEQWRADNNEKLETSTQILDRVNNNHETLYKKDLAEWKKALEIWEKDKTGKKPSKPDQLTEIKPIDEKTVNGLPLLPHGWTWLQVQDLCQVVRGGSPRPAGDAKYYDAPIPFLKVADITNNDGVYLDTYTYSIKEAGLNKTRLIQPKKLLLSNSGATLGVPKICLIQATFNDGIAAFLGLDEEALLYHYYFWCSKTQKLRGINQGAAQPNLNTDLIKEIFIPICSMEEMKAVSEQIEKILSVCDQIEKEIGENLQKSDALRQSILKKAFSGQLVAQDPKDEPASALLERIRAEKESSAARKDKGKRSAA